MIVGFKNQVIGYKEAKSSSKTGCFNYIMEDDTVASMQEDGSIQFRPSGSDGPFEQGQPSGNIVTFNSFGHFNAAYFAQVDKLL